MASSISLLLQQEIDLVEELPPDEQDALVEIIRRRQIERRRAEIAHNARITVQTFREGCARYGSVDDLRRELLTEPVNR